MEIITEKDQKIEVNLGKVGSFVESFWKIKINSLEIEKKCRRAII